MKRMVIAMLCLGFTGCTGIPQGLVAVDRFELERYLGTWYEAARIDNWFERGTEQVSATYSMRDDGMVRVVNRGYDPKKMRWSGAEGKAKFAGVPTVGALQVSFFGPFYASYNVIALDRGRYGWAMVTGRSRDYFWILSRMPRMERRLLDSLLADAHAKGFDTLKVIRPRPVQP